MKSPHPPNGCKSWAARTSRKVAALPWLGSRFSALPLCSLTMPYHIPAYPPRQAAICPRKAFCGLGARGAARVNASILLKNGAVCLKGVPLTAPSHQKRGWGWACHVPSIYTKAGEIWHTLYRVGRGPGGRLGMGQFCLGLGRNRPGLGHFCQALRQPVLGWDSLAGTRG